MNRRLQEPLLLLGGSLLVLVFTIWLTWAPGRLALPYSLLAGWVHYLGRMVPILRVDWPGTLTAIVCVAGLAIGLHLLRLRLPGAERRPSVVVTVAVVGLVVLACLAGVAVLGISHQTGWLLSGPEPLLEERQILSR